MRPALARLAALALVCGGLSCSGRPDPRIATPEATVRTLLEATHLLDSAPLAPTGRFRREAPPERPPPDLAALALCIWDFDRDDLASRGMADFVAGMLAAMQGQLVYRVGRHRTTVETGARTIVMRRSRLGWHVLLAESVPPEIREGLRSDPGSALRPGRGHEMP